MTIFEKIGTMDINEMAAWLDDLSIYDNTPWCSWFEDTYCKDCETLWKKVAGEERWIPCGWCELNDRCKFFIEIDDIPGSEDIVKMWLEKEYEY